MLVRFSKWGALGLTVAPGSIRSTTVLVASLLTGAKPAPLPDFMWTMARDRQTRRDQRQELMLANLERAHFYLPSDRREVAAQLEVYVRARVGSVFEGAA